MGTDCSFGSAAALASILAFSVASWKGYRAASEWWAEGSNDTYGDDDTHLIDKAEELTSGSQGHPQVLGEHKEGHEESKSEAGISPSIVADESNQSQDEDGTELSGDAAEDTSPLTTPVPDRYNGNNEHVQTSGQEGGSCSVLEGEAKEVETGENVIDRESSNEDQSGDSDQNPYTDNEEECSDFASDSDHDHGNQRGRNHREEFRPDHPNLESDASLTNDDLDVLKDISDSLGFVEATFDYLQQLQSLGGGDSTSSAILKTLLYDRWVQITVTQDHDDNPSISVEFVDETDNESAVEDHLPKESSAVTTSCGHEAPSEEEDFQEKATSMPVPTFEVVP